MAATRKDHVHPFGDDIPPAAGPPPGSTPALTDEEELAILFPESIKVSIRELFLVSEGGGPKQKRRRVREVVIEAKTINELVRFAAPLKRIAENVEDGTPFGDIVMAHHADFLEAIAIGTDLDRDVVGNLLPADFTKLLVAVVQVNGDFFVSALPVAGATILRIVKVIIAKLIGAGLIPASFSLPMVTGIGATSPQEPSTSSPPLVTDTTDALARPSSGT